MHMLSKKHLNLAELDTVRVSTNPSAAVTANGEVETHEEGTVVVHDLELFMSVQILQDTPAVLSLGKLCEEHGCSYELVSGQNATINQR